MGVVIDINDSQDEFERTRGYLLERAFLSRIALEAKNQGIKKNELARMAFSKSDPKRKINFLVKSEDPNDPTKVQRLTMRDAECLASALGKEFADVAWQAERYLTTIKDPSELDVIEFWDGNDEDSSESD